MHEVLQFGSFPSEGFRGIELDFFKSGAHRGVFGCHRFTWLSVSVRVRVQFSSGLVGVRVVQEFVLILAEFLPSISSFSVRFRVSRFRVRLAKRRSRRRIKIVYSFVTTSDSYRQSGLYSRSVLG